MSLLPWRAAVLTLLALCGPAFAQSFDAQQAQLEASLDEALPLAQSIYDRVLKAVQG